MTETTGNTIDGYERIEGYDPFGDGTTIYGCPECGATQNAGESHAKACSRRPAGP